MGYYNFRWINNWTKTYAAALPNSGIIMYMKLLLYSRAVREFYPCSGPISIPSSRIGRISSLNFKIILPRSEFCCESIAIVALGRWIIRAKKPEQEIHSRKSPAFAEILQFFSRDWNSEEEMRQTWSDHKLKKERSTRLIFQSFIHKFSKNF